jgi:tRNA(fMet)-specific endonuclease VapC
VILDTNALSAFAEGQEGAVDAVAKDARIAIPVVVLGEYRYGIAQSRRKSEYQCWLDELLLICQVLDIDEATSKVYADVRLELKRAGTPIPVNDTWIAALGRQHGLSILSRDTHFDAVRGLRRTAW